MSNNNFNIQLPPKMNPGGVKTDEEKKTNKKILKDLN